MELQDADPRLQRLLARTPVNLMLFGVGANVLLGLAGGAVSRFAAWHLTCDDFRPVDASWRAYPEVAGPVEKWTCGTARRSNEAD